MCQKFGHGKKRCADLKELPRCSLCAEILAPEDNSHQQCKKSPKCVNCEDNHGSFSRECCVYKAEYEITKIKTVDRVSYRIARQRYAELTRTQQPRTKGDAAEPPVPAALNLNTVSSDSVSKITKLTKNNNNTQNKTSPIKQQKTPTIQNNNTN